VKLRDTPCVAEQRVATACWVDDLDQVLESPTSTESFVDVGLWVANQIEAARDTRATPGQRLGPTPEMSRRSGTKEEIVTPLAIRPDAAIEAISRGQLFEPPLDNLTIVPETLEARGLSCSWHVTVRTNTFRTRRATLRIGPSPSGNLTVLQLVPLRARRFRATAFVGVGVPVIASLGQRLMHAASD